MKKTLTTCSIFSRLKGRAARHEARLAELGSDEHPPEQIDAWIEQAVGNVDEWLLIGGPPCQAYSTVGRSRNKKKKGYIPEEDKRHFLYREYLRIPHLIGLKRTWRCLPPIANNSQLPASETRS